MRCPNMHTAATFVDCGDTIALDLPLREGTAASDVQVSGGADSLVIRVGGARAEDPSVPPLFTVMQLFSTISPSDTRTEALGDGRLRVTLRKLDTGLRWPSLEASDEPQEVEKEVRVTAGEVADGGNALAERAKVQALLQAAQDGDVAALQTAAAAFGAGEVAAVRDGNGRCALHFAAQVGQEAACLYLLQSAGVSANVQDDNGETALSLAAGSGLLATVHALLQAGADPNVSKPGCAAPLHRAATSGNAAVIGALVEAGALLEATTDVGTPLLWAAGSGSMSAVAALLAAGASPSARAEGDVSAVFMAAASGSKDIVEALLAAGADAGAAALGGATPLHAAAEAGFLDIVLVLLQAGADPNAADGSGAPPIMAAAATGARECVETLLPLTKPVAGVAEWSVVGIMDAAAPPDLESLTLEDAQPAALVVPAAVHPDEAAAGEHKMRGDVAFRAALYQAAEEAYSDSLAGSTSDAVVWANRSAARLARGKAESALSDARMARTVDPAYSKAWYREGAAAKELLQWESAAQAFFEAYRLDPTNDALATAFQEAVQQGRIEFAAEQGV